MKRSHTRSCCRYGSAAALLALALALALPARTGQAQGCMPQRFTSPNLGGQGTSFLRPHEWQVGVGLRRVATHRFYVGDQQTESAAPGGQPLRIQLNSLNLSAAYGLSERTSLTLAVPTSYSAASSIHPDGLRHSNSAAGIGDISLTGSYWLRQPTQHPFSNAQVSLGVKAPTGSVHRTDDFFAPDGSVSQQFVPQTLQTGDGGFAVLVQLQAFQRLTPRLSLYQLGSYSASLKEHTDVPWPPAGIEWAVPDVYSGRVGLAWAAVPEHGLSVSLGGRIDGTTVADLVGGHDDFYRHAGYTMYADPGVSWVTGLNQLTLSVPVRLRHNYLSMTLSDGSVRQGSGGVNDFLIYVDFSRRM
jgi:hypothetical protein